MKDYIEDFNNVIIESDESRKTLKESMQKWLEVFKFPTVEATTYDRCEMTARNQIYPILGEKVITDITSADIRGIFNKMMTDGYAYTSVKKVHDLFNEYFRYLTQQELIAKNPMTSAGMIKKANYLSMQGKENLPQCDTITVFTEEEIKKFKEEAFSIFSNGKRKYQQASAYILMLNTGLRTGEILGLLNSDIDLEHRVMHLNRGVKEVSNRDGVTAQAGRQVKVGKLKTATSKRDVPLNDTAVAMIKDLREEMYFGENSPLIPDENGNFTRPVNFRKRFYRILKASGIETKGLHALRHTFATNLVNGIKQYDGTLKSLTTRQVADLLGHTTSEITETYYVKRDMKKLNGITDGFDF
jgi:integrase